jgi:hypothetical protein
MLYEIFDQYGMKKSWKFYNVVLQHPVARHTESVKFEIGSAAMIYIPTFINIGSGIKI